MPKLYKAPEVAEMLRLSVWQVRKLARLKKIKADKPGREFLFTETAIYNYRKRNS